MTYYARLREKRGDDAELAACIERVINQLEDVSTTSDQPGMLLGKIQSGKIRRHLTNQRTDAVAMSVLDPFEVFEIEVWPLPEYQDITNRSGAAEKTAARAHLDALERSIHAKALTESQFGAVLNEKDPPRGRSNQKLPKSFRKCVVGNEVQKIRSHPDFRLARRALIISRLAQVISERKVQGGLRRVLLTQARRFEWLAQRRYDALGGAASVEENSDSKQEGVDEQDD